MEIKHCTLKEKLECVYLTKENVKEFLKLVYPNLLKDDNFDKFIKEDTEKYILFNCGAYEKFYVYNLWYVKENYDWIGYSEEGFNETYIFVD